MSENSQYEIRQKLLEIQNELLKNTNAKKPETIDNIFSSANVKAKDEDADVMSILRELHANQYKILNMLSEINNKLK